MAVPLPDPELARRVGVLDQDDPVGSFDELGRLSKDLLLEFQQPDWFDGGKRFLDFGCGSGKLLRHLDTEAQRCEIHGCDIHEPSIRWVRDNLNPALRVFVCKETPPLPLPDDHFDLVWAGSVFTHLTDYWADWLVEVHRVLRPGGRLIATFLGKSMSESIAGERWDPDRIGMNVLRRWQGWDAGGPSVQHSEWWLREHWGRAFDVEHVDGERVGHGAIVLAKRDVLLSREELIQRSDDPRETIALAHSVEQLTREAAERDQARDAYETDRDAVMRALEDCGRDRDALVIALAEAERAIDAVRRSRSWRFTAPLRTLAGRRRRASWS